MIDHAVDSWILNQEAPGSIPAWSELFISTFPLIPVISSDSASLGNIDTISIRWITQNKITQYKYRLFIHLGISTVVRTCVQTFCICIIMYIEIC